MSPLIFGCIVSSTGLGKNLEQDTPAADPDTDSWPAIYVDALAVTRPGSTLARVGSVSAHTTWASMPTGTSNGGGYPVPNAAANTNALIALNPNFAIVSVNSDIGYLINTVGRTAAQIVVPTTGEIDAKCIANLAVIVGALEGAGIPTWVATIQPVNEFDGAPVTQPVIDAYLYLRTRQLASFRCVEFWGPLVDGSDTLTDGLALPDDVHPNAVGHGLLRDACVAARLDRFVAPPSTAASGFRLDGARSPRGARRGL